MNRTQLGFALALASTIVMSSCAETVVQVDDPSVQEIGPNGSVDIIATTTLPITGTPVELLSEMATGMSLLSAQISGDGDERATLRQIEAIWAVAKPDIEAKNRASAGDLQTTVDMAHNAVARVRPADADKAVQLLNNLIRQYPT